VCQTEFPETDLWGLISKAAEFSLFCCKLQQSAMVERANCLRKNRGAAGFLHGQRFIAEISLISHRQFPLAHSELFRTRKTVALISRCTLRNATRLLLISTIRKFERTL
jgi:hypothetical protein